MKETFDKLSYLMSKETTRAYSTSFSLGIYCLDKRFHDPIYAIYGFVRFADEIVDTFHDFDKATLLDEFERDTYLALERKVSMNPVLNSFQEVYHKYHISQELVAAFLKSMRWDLDRSRYGSDAYNEYIYGSAEAVGLMCLKAFAEGDDALYEKLVPYARSLGAAFQKVNFLRDIKDDFEGLGRIYFPGVNLARLTECEKKNIEADIEVDFKEALKGIKLLPKGARFGVYVAFVYYTSLFSKIKTLPSARIMMERIRINNYKKVLLLCSSYCRHSLRMI